MKPNNKIGSTGGAKLPKYKSQNTDNFLESLRDLGGGSVDSFKKDVAGGIPSEIMRQILGYGKSPARISGEIRLGETLDITRALDEEKKGNKDLKLQIQLERGLKQEEEVLVNKKSQEIRVELSTLIEEVGNLAKTTQGLARDVETATFQAPANPGVYHLVFFEKLREFIKSFRKKIENASVWLQSYNQRASKKRGFWGQVAKSGSKRLLSPEDYLQRSAG